MSEIDDLLELLNRASSSFRTLRATVHQRTDNAGMHQAVLKQHPEQLHGLSPLDRPPPGVIEFIERVWTDGQKRWRIERSGPRPDRRPPAVTVIDGTRWWLYSVETGAVSNAEEPETRMGNRSVLEPLLEPRVLFETSVLSIAADVTHAGRPGIAAQATPRPQTQRRPVSLGPFGFGDRHELIVDAERGIILRDVGLVNEKAFWLTDVEQIAFDEPLHEKVFVLEPPPGVELRTTMYPRPRPVPIEEAARLAPFPVFLPTYVPAGAQTQVSYQPAQDRPPLEPSVFIEYSGPDERSKIVVTEHATASLWEPLRSTEEWETVVEGESTLLYNERSRFQGERAVRVDRDGTTVFIHGGPDRQWQLEIEREVLFAIARSLVPVPGKPPAAAGAKP